MCGYHIIAIVGAFADLLEVAVSACFAAGPRNAALFIIREECDIGKDSALERCKSSKWKAHTTSIACAVADALPVGDLLRTAGWTALGLSRHAVCR
jgi:hypothetical protein